MVCYENRNGMLFAYDVEIGEFVSGASNPEEMRDELQRRGVKKVLVHRTGTPWLTGSITYCGLDAQAKEFRRIAARSQGESPIWKAVPVDRIGDGSALV